MVDFILVLMYCWNSFETRTSWHY